MSDERPRFIRKFFDPDDGRVRCWACKDYIGCGDYFVIVIRAGTARKLPLITFCTKCAREVGEMAR